MQEFQATFSLKIVAIITSLLAILSYLLDFFKAGFIKMTGFEAIEFVLEGSDEIQEACVLFAFICAVIAFVLVLVGLKGRSVVLTLAAIVSLIGVAFLICSVVGDMSEYISTGVFAFFISSIATAVISFCMVKKQK